jgi:hypothetical protein
MIWAHCWSARARSLSGVRDRGSVAGGGGPDGFGLGEAFDAEDAAPLADQAGRVGQGLDVGVGRPPVVLVERDLELELLDGTDGQGIERRPREHELAPAHVDARGHEPGAHAVEVTAEPSRGRHDAVRAHDVAGLELELLGRVVEEPGRLLRHADPVQDRDLALVVEVADRRQARVQPELGRPGQGKDLGLVHGHLGPHPPIAGVLRHRDDRVEAVVAAEEVDDHEDAVAGGGQERGRVAPEEGLGEGEPRRAQGRALQEFASVQSHGRLLQFRWKSGEIMISQTAPLNFHSSTCPPM